MSAVGRGGEGKKRTRKKARLGKLFWNSKKWTKRDGRRGFGLGGGNFGGMKVKEVSKQRTNHARNEVISPGA